MKYRISFGIAVFFSLIPVISGALNISIGTVGQQLHRMLSDPYMVYGASFILFFRLLYGIFAASLTKVTVFKSDNGINNQGKIVAVSLGLLGAIGCFYYFKNIEAAIKRVDGAMGFFAGVALAVTIFAITYFNMKTTEEKKLHAGPAFFAAAMALIVYGMFADNQSATSWGTLILLITAIWAAIKAIGAINGGPKPMAYTPTPLGSHPGQPSTPTGPTPETTSQQSGLYPEVQSVNRNDGKMQGIIREVR